MRSIYSALSGNPEGFTLNSTTPYFNDVGASHLQFVYIQKLKELGLTNGCDGNGNYCPEGTLTYGQLAKLAVLGRQVRDGKGLTLTCQDYDCNNQIYPDVSAGDIFYAYIQRTYRLLNEQAAPPPVDGCPYVYTPLPMRQFCENMTVPRGRFAIYLVSLVMNVDSRYLMDWPGGGGLPAVQSPRGSGANPINDTCSGQAAVESALQHTNEFIWIGGSQFAWSRTTINTGSGNGALPSPRLYTTYLYSELVRQYPSPTINLEMTGGSGTEAALQTQVSDAVQLTSQHGVISGCLNGVAQPDIVGLLTSAVTPPGQPVTTLIKSMPVGIPLTVDGVSCTSTATTVCTYNWEPGTQHTISAPSVLAGGAGTQYRFVGWSDGKEISHTVTAPSATSTFTANFGTWYLLSLAVTPAGAGSIAASPNSGDGYYQSGAAVEVSATPAMGQQFLGFSGSLSGATTPQSLTMAGPMSVAANFSGSATPDFSIAPISSIPLYAGDELTVPVAIVPTNGYSEPVSLSYTPVYLPTFTAVTFTSLTLSPGAWSTTMTVSLARSAQPGVYSITIAADGSMQRTQTFSLTILPPSPDKGSFRGATCAPSAIGISHIEYDSDNVVRVTSTTLLNYCAALTYDAYVEAYIYQEDFPNDPIFGAWAQDCCVAQVTAYATPVGGNDYDLLSDHYVIAFQVVGFVDPLTPIFYDPAGYSLISNAPTVGDRDIDAPYGPGVLDVFVLAEYMYLGTTKVKVSTSDQSPIIYDVTPASADAGTSVPITITGEHFGLNPTIEFSGSGIHAVVTESNDGQINAVATIDPDAELGGYTLDVLSNGSSGLGFLQGSGKSSRSQNKTFTVTGNDSCPATIPHDGQKYSLNSNDYRTTTIPLRVQSPCPGTVSWSIKFRYLTTRRKGNTSMGPYIVTDVLRTANDSSVYNFETPVGTGGLIDATATITFNGSGKSTKKAATFYVDGVTIPPSVINAQLIQLYADGGNTHLMTGLAAHESGTIQFGRCNGIDSCNDPFVLFGKTGLWPKESYDGGSHIGIMQVPTNMADAYDWQQNVQDGVYLFANDKLRRAGNYEALVRQRFPRLRALTLQESELDALVYFGPAAVHVSDPCNNCILGQLGAYWVPNSKGTDWIPNVRHDLAVQYVTSVLSKVQ